MAYLRVPVAAKSLTTTTRVTEPLTDRGFRDELIIGNDKACAVLGEASCSHEEEPPHAGTGIIELRFATGRSRESPYSGDGSDFVIFSGVHVQPSMAITLKNYSPETISGGGTVALGCTLITNVSGSHQEEGWWRW